MPRKSARASPSASRARASPTGCLIRPRSRKTAARPLPSCQVFEIFFGGARGGGKTDGVLGEFGAHASRYGKDAIGLMVRRSRRAGGNHRTIAGNLRPARLETQRDGKDVACAGWRPVTLRLSGARCRCRHVPGPQLHASLCRGDREFPEPRRDEVDGDAALRRGRLGMANGATTCRLASQQSKNAPMATDQSPSNHARTSSLLPDARSRCLYAPLGLLGHRAATKPRCGC